MASRIKLPVAPARSTIQTALFLLVAIVGTRVSAESPFVIRVVDTDTRRGVPLVELKTTHNVRFFTDNSGIVAIDDAGLVNEEAFFFVTSHGYEFPKDGFGYRGRRLRVEPGKSVELAIARLNIAERLYRVTGAGLYEHAVRAGQTPLVEQSRANAQIVGCDSPQTAIYNGKLYWFWGDTHRLGYPLGNFQASGATSELPAHGGLDPAAGVNLRIFEDDKGFAREMAAMPGSGPTWLKGLAVVKDQAGGEHLIASYSKIKPPYAVYDRGLCEFDPKLQRFKKLFSFEKTAPLVPTGHAFRHQEGDQSWLYFGEAVPHMRVPDRYESLIDPVQYQPVKADVHFTDAVTDKPVKHHHGAVEWNPYRKKWVSIFVREHGDSSYLGEIYYAEADAPEGPWRKAVKIVSHKRYSFYDPKQHPYFAAQDGRYLFFEGTYSVTFAGNTDPTPLYDYNQIMYRLDLADPRLQAARN